MPVWLAGNLYDGFFGDFTVSSSGPSGYCGIVFGGADRQNYYRVVLLQGRCAYERIQMNEATLLSARSDTALQLMNQNSITIHLTNGKPYIYVNSAGFFPVEFVGTGEGMRLVGLIQDKGMKVAYRFRIKQVQ